MKTAAPIRYAAIAFAAGLLSTSGAAFAQDAMGKMQSNQTPSAMSADKMAKPMTKEEKMAADKKMKADKMAMAKHDAMTKKDAMKKDSMKPKGAM
jgi:pentapeptide MXKDX repeat protein